MKQFMSHKKIIFALIFYFGFLLFIPYQSLIAQPSLDDLPEGPVLIVLHHLKFEDLIAVSQVSKKFYKWSHHDQLWQHYVLDLTPYKIRKINAPFPFPVQYLKVLAEFNIRNCNDFGFHTRSATTSTWKSDDLILLTTTFPDLKNLLIEPDIRPYILPHLSKFHELQELTINGRSLESKHLHEIGKLTQLKRLRLQYFQGLNDDGIKNISPLSHLEEIGDIETFNISETGIQLLNGFKHLKTLDLRKCSQTSQQTPKALEIQKILNSLKAQLPHLVIKEYQRPPMRIFTL